MSTFTDRIVPFEACFNFRDLGGYGTADGRVIAFGRLYRSDTLHRMTPADVARFAGLGVRTVYDLRAQHELEEYGNVPGDIVLTHVHVPILDTVRRPASPTEPAPEADQPAVDQPAVEQPVDTAVLGGLYLGMLESGQRALVRIFEGLADADALPAVFHCLAGKDRTGIVAALVLSALGVPESIIVEDYVLTQHTRERSRAWIVANEPATAALFEAYPASAREARAETMVGFLDAITERYGSVDGLLADLGIDPAVVGAMAANLLV